MRRLISTLAAGLLAGGTVLAGGIASAGTGGTASPGAALVHHRATTTCTNEGPLYFNVTKNGANYFLGTPNNTSSGASAILKPKKNSTTLWTLCVFPTSNTVVFQNRNLALTSRSTSPGTVVTMTGVGNGGDGFSSQRWNYAFVSSSTITFQNVKTGLFLRVRNSGPKIGQSVTTGFTPTDWTISQ